MKTILLIIIVFFIVLFLLAFLAPFLGTGFLIGYVIKNSLQKKTPEFLQNEKLEMEAKVESLKQDLDNWKNATLFDITNDIEYSYKKAMSSRLTGHINSQNQSPIIAFQRIDRGLYINSRILACSTDFKIYYEYTNNEILVFYDDSYLGKIINNAVITNALNLQIGTCNQDSLNNPNSYCIEFGAGTVAEIVKNSDRKNFVKNPFYKRVNSPYEFERHQINFREAASPNSLIHSVETTDPKEIKWIIAIAIFECVYHGFDFTS